MPDLPSDYEKVPCRLEAIGKVPPAIITAVTVSLKNHGYDELIPGYRQAADGLDYHNLMLLTHHYVYDPEASKRSK